MLFVPILHSTRILNENVGRDNLFGEDTRLSLDGK